MSAPHSALGRSPERVAIVGSRQGADLEDVIGFVRALWAKHPDTILVSGGALGVDLAAENEWCSLGGSVESYRPKAIGPVEWAIEKWELGPTPSVRLLIEDPTFANFKSAALYRDMLIAEVSNRVVAFMAPGGSRGASFTAEMGENYGKDTYRYFAEAAA